jgi:hypothetical protein
MKSNCQLFLFINLLLWSILFLSCSNDTSTNSSKDGINFISYQVGGCNGSSSLEKVVRDSCFSYSFYDTLKIDFCVSGNCCPDTNRFVTTYKLNSDTINVTVVDTAGHLCKCICNYKIHIELSGLTNNQYFFYCSYDGLEYKKTLIKAVN